MAGLITAIILAVYFMVGMTIIKRGPEAWRRWQNFCRRMASYYDSKE